jgi:cyclic beta-1,2-glucan synthetase
MLGSAVFEAEHVHTRDQTLHGIEQLSRRSGHSELVVAEQLLKLMQQGASLSDPSVSVPCYWLIGTGRAQLLHALGLRESGWKPSLTLPLYLGVLVLATLSLVTWLLLPGRLGWSGLAAAWLMLFPASEAVIALMNRLISESASPEHLPRLALRAGIAPLHRVLVVIPAMLSDVAAIDALVRRLELHFVANPQQEAQFALLSDWADADVSLGAIDSSLEPAVCRFKSRPKNRG